jgi:hypothetical protein
MFILDQENILVEAEPANGVEAGKFPGNPTELLPVHQERCARLGLDPMTPIVDQGCTSYLDPQSAAWKRIDLGDPTLPPGVKMIVQSSTLTTPEVLPPSPDPAEAVVEQATS